MPNKNSIMHSCLCKGWCGSNIITLPAVFLLDVINCVKTVTNANYSVAMQMRGFAAYSLCGTSYC